MPAPNPLIDDLFFREAVNIRFNFWKHHLHHVSERIYYTINNHDDTNSTNEIIENIKSINSNYVDVYTGYFKPIEIIMNIKEKLEVKKITNREQFVTWLGRQEFNTISLSDGSVWVLREGNEQVYYIHLHPARTGPHMLRIQGNWWKTAVFIRLLYPDVSDPDPAIVNFVRKEKLGISPVRKDRYDSERLKKIMDYLK